MINIIFPQNQIKYLILLFVFLLSCTERSPDYIRYKKTMGTEVNVKMIESFIHDEKIISFHEIREKYKYISLVYLKENCYSCYKKFINWNIEMNKYNLKNHTVVFIIIGRFDDEFLTNVKQIDDVSVKYYLFMDPNSSFLKGNQGIPEWIFENSILIDAKNKIRLIGEPFENSKLADRFIRITKN